MQFNLPTFNALLFTISGKFPLWYLRIKDFLVWQTNWWRLQLAFTIQSFPKPGWKMELKRSLNNQRWLPIPSHYYTWTGKFHGTQTRLSILVVTFFWSSNQNFLKINETPKTIKIIQTKTNWIWEKKITDRTKNLIIKKEKNAHKCSIYNVKEFTEQKKQGAKKCMKLETLLLRIGNSFGFACRNHNTVNTNIISVFDQYEGTAENACFLALLYKIDTPLIRFCYLDTIFWLTITIFNLHISQQQNSRWREQLLLFSVNLHKETIITLHPSITKKLRYEKLPKPRMGEISSKPVLYISNSIPW